MSKETMIDGMPTLYGQSKTGKIKRWRVQTQGWVDSDKAILETIYGFLDGEEQRTEKFIYGKNIGKSNETSAFKQANLEAASLWRSKKDEGFAESVDDIVAPEEVNLFLPMLAETFEDAKSHLTFPLYGQPKYDGCRMLAKKENGKVTMWSRKGKLITIPFKIQQSLEQYLPEGGSTDGELYVHGWSFQRVVKAIKKYSPDTDSLQYHIYDVPVEKLSFKDRFFENLKAPMPANLVKSETKLLETMEEALEQLEVYLSLGYEGQMLRNVKGLYQYKYRSNDLQKMKVFVDAEYLVVDVEEASGRDIGTAVFICETGDGKRFKARPMGTLETRAEYLKNFDTKYKGKRLTVKYQEVTEDGIPRFPVGLRFRPDWDMS